jgi:hypothetical protein
LIDGKIRAATVRERRRMRSSLSHDILFITVSACSHP